MNTKKALDLTYANFVQEKTSLAQRNRNAATYSASVKALRKRKHNYSLRKTASIILGCAACAAVFTWTAVDAFGLAPTETEQKYIVRYGEVNEPDTNGNLVITTTDGNVWTLQDGPLHDAGDQVRVLFDSKGTLSVEDDVIVDITER